MSKLGTVIDFINEKGLPEFDYMQAYKKDAVITFEGKLYIALQDIAPTKVECCEIVDPPSCNEKWAYFIDCHTFINEITSLTNAITALEDEIPDLRGIENVNLSVNRQSGKFELLIEDTKQNNLLTIPLKEFGLFEANSDGSFKYTNATGSEVTIPAHQAKTKVVNSGGNETLGFIHQESEIHGEPNKTINIVSTNDLSLLKGFRFNPATNQWEVDLSGIIDNSSLTWDNGRLRISDDFKLERNNYVNSAITQLDRIIQAREADLLNNANAYTDANTRLIHSQFTELLQVTRDSLEASDRNIRDLLNDVNSSLNNRINTLGNDLTSALNLAITNVRKEMLNEFNAEKQSLQAKIDALQSKSEETCKIPIKNIDSDYTIQDADNTLIAVNTRPITITLDPNVIPTGRLFTVIQAGTSKVSFVSTNPSTLVAPLDGSLTMAGTNAAVSILFEINKYVRILGQTE